MISIITINYNNANGLKDTISSVLAQDYKNIEYIIIDGASSDHSKEIIEAHEEHVSYWLSEPDNGVYNAMNKGIKAAKGDYLLFLNSGDTFVDSSILSNVAPLFVSQKDIYYGNLQITTKDGRQNVAFPEQLTFLYFFENSLPHPATFIKRSLFETVFYYNETYRIVSDWEFFMVAICKQEASYEHFSIEVSVFGLDGMSCQPENRERISEERNHCIQKHFPLFYEDYKEFLSLKKISQSNRFQGLLALEKSQRGRKLASLMLRLVKPFA